MYRKSPSKIWRKRQNVYRLVGSKSTKTGKTYYPPVQVETGTNNTSFDQYEFPPKSKLVTWSVVRVGSSGFDYQTPYVIGILELENGERLTSQIVDVEFGDLKKGDILYPTFRKIYVDSEDSVISYAIKWTK